MRPLACLLLARPSAPSALVSAVRPTTPVFRSFSSPRTPPPGKKNEFPVLPLIAIFLAGFGSYALLVRSRAKPTQPTQQ